MIYRANKSENQQKWMSPWHRCKNWKSLKMSLGMHLWMKGNYDLNILLWFFLNILYIILMAGDRFLILGIEGSANKIGIGVVDR